MWRRNNFITTLTNLEFTSSGRLYDDGKRCRDILKKIVNSARGRVGWQARATHQGID